jgi:hypothetical protein
MMFGVRTDIPGMTQERYDRMHDVLGPKGLAAKGFVLHMAGPTGDSWYTIEVWESKADHDRFVQDEVLPLLPPGNATPAMQEFEVYTYQPS